MSNYYTEKCHPDLCKFALPYYGNTTAQIGWTCCYDHSRRLLTKDSTCWLACRLAIVEASYKARFDK